MPIFRYKSSGFFSSRNPVVGQPLGNSAIPLLALTPHRNNDDYHARHHTITTATTTTATTTNTTTSTTMKTIKSTITIKTIITSITVMTLIFDVWSPKPQNHSLGSTTLRPPPSDDDLFSSNTSGQNFSGSRVLDDRPKESDRRR